MKQELVTFALSVGCIALGYLAGFRAGRRSQARDMAKLTEIYDKVKAGQAKVQKAVDEHK